MGLKKSERFFESDLSISVEDIISTLDEYYSSNGYQTDYHIDGESAIFSFTKSGMFKTLSGLKTGLEIKITQYQGGYNVEINPGIFGKQAAATAASMLIAWPLLLTQIYGMLKQNKMDEEAYSIIYSILNEKHSSIQQPHSEPMLSESIQSTENISKFCSNCGTQLTDGAKFCSNCGAKID